MFRTTAELIQRCFKERIDNLEQNEKDLKEEAEEQATKKALGEDPENDFIDDSDGDSDDEDDMDDDDAFEKTKKRLAAYNKGGMDDELDDDDDDDDSDYENAGGDMNLYDSKLDDIDELKYMQETINGLS